MEQRTLELQLVSGKDLKNLNLFSKMDVFAVVSLNGDTRNGKQTAVTALVPKCGTNPTFNYTIGFTLDDTLLTQNRLSLTIQLRRPGIFNVIIGTVNLNLKQLFDSANPKDTKLVSYRVFRPHSRRFKGELTFSYKFGDKKVMPGYFYRPVQQIPKEIVGLGLCCAPCVPCLLGSLIIGSLI